MFGLAVPVRAIVDANRENRWHVGKEVPLAFILTIFLQTSAGVWWLSQLSSKVDAAIAAMEEFKAERYTKEDARRDRELLVLMIHNMQTKASETDRRIDGIERTINGISRR